jgi:predicted metal-dependent TIM-barrel fold hydrolase
MMLIDPHAHMISRTTDDYERMAAAGTVAVIEPAFWIGQPRTSVGSYLDYLSSIVGFERFRAGQFGIRHYCTVGLNSKEANNEELAEGVMELIPRFALKEGVVAIGEIGYDEQTALEDKYFRLQLELAKKLDLPVMIHTPHRDKKRGTSRSMDVCDEHGLDPRKVIVDHNNEETVRETLDRGYWAAFSIYPSTKMGNERMVEILRQHGARNIIVDSACDWGISEPLGVAKTAKLALQKGISQAEVDLACYRNALEAYGQSGQMKESDWLNPPAIDQRNLYEGNSILRGGREPKVEDAKQPRRSMDDLIIK